MNHLLKRLWAKSQLLAGRTVVLGSVDRPTPRPAPGGASPRPHEYAAWIDVRGWALSLDGTSPVTVQLLIDGRLAGEVEATLPRPKLQERFPKIASSGTAGFEARLNSDVLPSRGGATLHVVGVSRGRPGRTLLGSIPIARQELVMSRSAYGRVWDEDTVSGSLTNARISVAGVADLAEYDRTGLATASDIVEHARVKRTDTVLEIGCGTGRIGSKLAPQCGHLISADVSRNMLRHARQTLASHTNVTFVGLNGLDLTGIDDGAADVVCCSGVFMHLDEWDRYRYIVDAMRVLRPGGRLYIDNFNLASDDGWAIFAALYTLEPAARPPNISRSSTPPELIAYTERAGFTDVTCLTRGLWVTVVATKPGA